MVRPSGPPNLIGPDNSDYCLNICLHYNVRKYIFLQLVIPMKKSNLYNVSVHMNGLYHVECFEQVIT